MLEFHKKWYSSNITNLVVLGKYDISQLENWVVTKFSPVKNFDVSVPNLGDPAPFLEENLGKLLKYVPVQDKDVLSFFYILPYYGKRHSS